MSSVLSAVTDDAEDATAEGALNVLSWGTADLRGEPVHAVGQVVDLLPVGLQHRLKLTQLALKLLHPSLELCHSERPLGRDLMTAGGYYANRQHQWGPGKIQTPWR